MFDDEGPKLPTLVPGIRPAYSTPLPMLPMIVLCIVSAHRQRVSADYRQWCPSSSLRTCAPHSFSRWSRVSRRRELLLNLLGFFDAAGHEKNSETEAAVGLWTGNLVSVFFITQFFTSLLWSSIADRHGRRAVMVASMAVRSGKALFHQLMARGAP